MKQKLIFNVTVGSYWPEKTYEHEIVFPRGGVMRIIEVEFESDTPYDYNAGRAELAKTLEGKEYHIWYWWWGDVYRIKTV